MSLTPEHDKLDGGDHGFNHRGPLHPDLGAAYAYVDRVIHTADKDINGYLWHGWALREAFLAGVSHAKKTPT